MKRALGFMNKALPVTYNTYIGGVSSTISTASLLATKLGISVGNISNFTVVGSDIKCKITGSYAIPFSAFQFNTTPCTYYIDSDYLVTSLGNNAFYATYNFVGLDADFQNAVTIGSSAFSRVYANRILLKYATSIGSQGFWDCIYPDVYYIPSCTNLGGSAGNNSVFENIKASATIYCHPSLATNNSGGEDGDIAYARSRGCAIRYVSSFTTPNAVTTLSAGTVYNTAIQLNFTPPSSTNTIDYYECYVNGVFKNNITASGQYITGFTASTSYSITLIAVDIFYNKSAISNILTQSTANNSWDISTGLVSYYKLDANSNDGYGSNNGINTNITYAAGKLGNAATFNGTSSLITVLDSESLSFNNATNDLPFSISYWINVSNTQMNILTKSSSGGGTREYECQYDSGSLLFRLISGGNASNRLDQRYTMTINTGNWIHIVHTYNGTGSGGMKTYVNGNLAISTNTVTGTYSKMSNTTNPITIGAFPGVGGYFLNGKLDEIPIYNIELTAGNVTTLYNSGSGITL